LKHQIVFVDKVCIDMIEKGLFFITFSFDTLTFQSNLQNRQL